MPEPAIPKILILESDQALAQKRVALMEAQGWAAISQGLSKDALLVLEKSKSSPFDLFISNYQLPKMAGDDVLKAAKAVSPMTQRMLLVPSNQSDLVIRAINKAEIHACIVTPASDQDLINRVKACLAAFRRNRKLEQLKRVTAHQNKQMFQIAHRLKKKDKIFQDKISEQKAEVMLLRSKLKALTPKQACTTLEERTQALDIPMTPASLKQEFLAMADHILALFDSGAAKAGTPRTDIPDLTLPLAQALPAPGKDVTQLSAQIIRTALAAPKAPSAQAPDDLNLEDQDGPEALVAITLSEDRSEAFATFKTPSATLPLNDFLELLRRKEILFGILDDTTLETWLKAPGNKPFCIAKGEKPVPGRDGSVTYNFETDYTNPGKIMEDGRIDFRDRGSIPFVSEGDILAARLPAQQGKGGISVAGEAIAVAEPFDPVFIGGSGTTFSEDGNTIIAAIDGQPHLDYMGEISVNPELPIKGDVDFQTGNINFNGHIVVSGTVKEGFTVKGFSLTAKEIEGATIDLTGDLHVSDGITDADIISSGNIYAKFINNSKVKAFGDIAIQKEIIDSSVLISGKCKNETGIIIASRVSAKGGIDAGKVGTSSSKPVLLKVGVNEHIDNLTGLLEEKLKASVERLSEIREKVREVEDQDQDLYGQITEKAQLQEGAENRLKAIKKEIAELKKAGNAKALADRLADYKAQEQLAKTAEQELNAIFEIQNRFAKQIGNYKSIITQIEETNKNLVLRKKGLKEFADRIESRPKVSVAKSITMDTVITGPNTSLTLREDRRRCQIMEKGVSDEGLHFYEMEVTDL